MSAKITAGKTLAVLIGDTLVGQLESRGPRRYRFQYAEPVVAEHEPGSLLLSASLRVQADAFSPSESAPFFEGLLPEGVVRHTIARKLRIAEEDSFSLLRELGADVAGAVVILPADSPLPSARQGEIRWLDDSELAQRVDDLPRSPLGITVDDEQGARLSLGGVQGKLVLTRAPNGRLGIPLHGAPSTHILKPGQAEEYPGIVANEAFCLRVARCAGLSAAAAEVIAPAGAQWLLVERFDRSFSDDVHVTRVHQEDFCQATGRREKYETDGGPSVVAAIELLRSVSTRSAQDILSFIDTVAFNVLLGNSDAHGKNYALLYGEAGEARLAPLYDLVCTNVYDLEPRMAMRVGSAELPDEVSAEAWRSMAAEAGLGAAHQLVRRVFDMASRVLACARATRELAQAEGWHHPILDEIVDLVERRAGRIAA